MQKCNFINHQPFLYAIDMLIMLITSYFAHLPFHKEHDFTARVCGSNYSFRLQSTIKASRFVIIILQPNKCLQWGWWRHIDWTKDSEISMIMNNTMTQYNYLNNFLLTLATVIIVFLSLLLVFLLLLVFHIKRTDQLGTVQVVFWLPGVLRSIW